MPQISKHTFIPDGMNAIERNVKRISDCIIAFLCLIIFSTLYKGKNDERLTKIGRFLRVHHLDELPQLWNVFIGDMSFVGYRPERKFYIDQIMEKDPRYVFLFQIRPGVTSYATLYNGYTDTMEKMLRRLRYDLFYLKHRSWLFDMRVLVLTFLNIAFGKKF